MLKMEQDKIICHDFTEASNVDNSCQAERGSSGGPQFPGFKRCLAAQQGVGDKGCRDRKVDKLRIQ